MSEWLGPIPSPDALQKYKDIQQDFPERVIAMAEREAAHRHEVELAALDLARRDKELDAEDQRLSEWSATLQQRRFWASLSSGFLICLLVLGIGWAALLRGYEKLAAALCSVTVVALATVFVLGKYPPQREEEDDESQTE